MGLTLCFKLPCILPQINSVEIHPWDSQMDSWSSSVFGLFIDQKRGFHIRVDINRMANSICPDDMAPKGAISSGSILFANIR